MAQAAAIAIATAFRVGHRRRGIVTTASSVVSQPAGTAVVTAPSAAPKGRPTRPPGAKARVEMRHLDRQP